VVNKTDYREVTVYRNDL